MILYLIIRLILWFLNCVVTQLQVIKYLCFDYVIKLNLSSYQTVIYLGRQAEKVKTLTIRRFVNLGIGTESVMLGKQGACWSVYNDSTYLLLSCELIFFPINPLIM